MLMETHKKKIKGGGATTDMDIFQILTHTLLDLELQSHLASCIHTTQLAES